MKRLERKGQRGEEEGLSGFVKSRFPWSNEPRRFHRFGKSSAWVPWPPGRWRKANSSARPASPRTACPRGEPGLCSGTIAETPQYYPMARPIHCFQDPPTPLAIAQGHSSTGSPGASQSLPFRDPPAELCCWNHSHWQKKVYVNIFFFLLGLNIYNYFIDFFGVNNKYIWSKIPTVRREKK